eukprot:14822635-Alexandrium_andersonii.AAC.1
MVQERAGAVGASLRPAFARIQPGRGSGQTDGGPQPLVERTVQVAGRAAADAVRLRTAEFSTIAAAVDGGYFARAADSDWEEACIAPPPRNLLPLLVGRLSGASRAHHARAVACPAGMAFRGIDAPSLSALLAGVGYEALVRECFRPVLLRPVPGADGGARLRLASTTADAAEHCFVLTAGSHSADDVRTAAERVARVPFTVREVLADAGDGSGEHVMARLAGQEGGKPVSYTHLTLPTIA